MISSTLQQAFLAIEYTVFPTWQKAGEEERAKIVRKLGRFEGDMIMREINKTCKLKYKTIKNEKT